MSEMPQSPEEKVIARIRDDAPRFVEREKLPQAWNVCIVADRLVDAFVTLDRLPCTRGPRVPGGHWPRTLTEWADQIAQAELEESERRTRQQAANRIVITPTPIEITQMEMVFGWLSELRIEDHEMALVIALWAARTARGASIKALCVQKRWRQRTFFRKRSQGLAFLVALLNRGAVSVF